MTVLLIDKPHPFLVDALSALGMDVRFHYDTPRQDILRILPEADGVVMRSRLQADKEFIDAGSKLSFIAREGVGIEHIDTPYAENKGISILTSPEGSRDTVAEHTLGLLLSLMNNLARADRQIRQGQWIREGNRAYELKDKTVGILGYGHMGSAFAERLQGFQCKVIAYDKFKSGYANALVQEVDLPTFWREAQVLSIHIPYLPENQYFINKDFLSAFHHDLFVVNTARGTVLDTAALVDGLKSKRILGAALDVLEYEETSFEFLRFDTLPEPFHYLRNADNVVLSPHIAGWSFESKLGHAQVLADKIGQLLIQRKL
jgi:D-3-phosphoglycerate dehydrogenase / 2-oxoglutarate reductase